ncbi:hypothetical protein [Catenulispora subtropica]|uniref:Uncharacterized protein n=1 Tax=Catenulispora subtropica TaxID=450798 RepID=A0ABN2QR76_9ACTN
MLVVAGRLGTAVGPVDLGGDGRETVGAADDEVDVAPAALPAVAVDGAAVSSDDAAVDPLSDVELETSEIGVGEEEAAAGDAECFGEEHPARRPIATTATPTVARLTALAFILGLPMDGGALRLSWT